MRSDILKEVFDIIAQRKSFAELKAEEIEDKAFESEEISEAFSRLKELEFEEIKNKADGKGKSLDGEIKKAKEKYLSSLKKHGYCEKDFVPDYRCKKCSDTGKADGKLCECAIEIYRKILLERSKQNCLTFNFDNVTAKDKNDKEHLNFGKLFVEKYPSKKTLNIILSGETGIGKTVLASCIANGVLDKGYTANFVTAFDFIQKCLKYHTSPVSERGYLLDEFFDCDLLVLDDLGTEPMLKNVTVEYLMILIGEREKNSKHMIFTTNLNQNQILAKYGERVFSRLTNKAISLFKILDGKDKRIN